MWHAQVEHFICIHYSLHDFTSLLCISSFALEKASELIPAKCHCARERERERGRERERERERGRERERERERKREKDREKERGPFPPPTNLLPSFSWLYRARHCTQDHFIPHGLQSILETRSAAFVLQSPCGESLTIATDDVLDLFSSLSVHIKGRH